MGNVDCRKQNEKRGLWSGAAALILVLPELLGCSSDYPETVRVSGAIIYDGTAVEGARVNFLPARGRPATAGTDAEGKYILTTFESGDGALPGSHTVTVTKIGPVNLNDPYFRPEELLPLRYASADTSPLKVEVKSGEKNEFEFRLTDE